MSAAQYLYKRFTMPKSGKLIEVRRVAEGSHPEVTVREVDDNDELSAFEYELTLRFLLAHGKEVRRV